MTDPSDWPAMVFNVGPDGTILYVHSSELAPEEVDIRATSIIDHTLPHERDVVRSTLERVFATGEADEYECRGFPPFIEDPCYRCRVAPNMFEGAVISATVIMRDVTRWRRERDELRNECDELKAQLEQRSDEPTETGDEQDSVGEKLRRASADVMRLTDALRERNQELEYARARRREDHHQQNNLSAEVARVTEERLTLATTAQELAQECARHEARVKDLSDELAIQACLHDRQDRERVRYRQILDQAGEAIFITDPQTRQFVDVNETACRWLGRSRDELLKLKTDDLDLEFPIDASNELPEHVVDTRKSARAQVLRNGAVRRRNGTTFAVEVAIAGTHVGGRTYTLIVARETNARRPVEEALRESEEKYHDLFNFSHDAIYLSARDGTVADVNAAAVELFGYSREEFLGLPARDLYKRATEISAFQRAVDENGFVRDLAVTFRAKDGTPIRGLLSATLRHAGDGTVLGYQCSIRPLSDRLSVAHHATDEEVGDF